MKEWKIVLAVFSIMLLAGAGTFFYLLEVKTYETQDPQVEEVITEEYDIALPGDSNEEAVAEDSSTAETSDGTTEEGISAETKETVEGSGKKDGSPNTDSKTLTSTNINMSSSKSLQASSSDLIVSSPNGKVESKPGTGISNTKSTAGQIAAKFEPSFRQLESQANEKIEALVGHAVSEYIDKKKIGEEISYFYFYSKYNTAGKILERNTDYAFNYVYKALLKDLKDNGYDSAAAQRYKTAYESAKKQRRAALINKAKAAL